MAYALTEVAVAIVASVLMTIMVAGAGAAVAPVDDAPAPRQVPTPLSPDRLLPNALT